MKRIEPQDLLIRPFQILDQDWALLVAGLEAPNPMTVSWGGFGTLWNRPVVTVYVRPTRFTYELLNGRPEFTLNFLPEEFRGALELCGTRSGRDLDKWTASGLHRVESAIIATPRVAESALALECRLLATLDIDPQRFVDPSVDENYPARDYHRVYIGEALAAWAEDRFVRK